MSTPSTSASSASGAAAAIGAQPTNKLSVRSEAWDACAEKYDIEGTVVVSPHATYMLDRSLGFLKTRAPAAAANSSSNAKFSIADIACGSGALSLEAVSRAEIGNVLASDFSETMCKITQRKYETKREKEPAKTSELKTLVADATALSSIPDNTYDAAFCSFGVMLTPDPHLAVRELVRITKPDGIIGITTWSRAERSQFHAFQMAIQTHIKKNLPPPEPVAAPPSDAAASNSLPVTVPSMASMPFSGFEEFQTVFAANKVDVELLEYHDGVTRVYEGAAGFWAAMRGVTPVGVKAASQDEATGKGVIEFVSQTFGEFAPFNLRSTSIVAIGRKRQA